MQFQAELATLERWFEEVITPEEFGRLLDSKLPIRHYIGFEISGKVHLGTGLMSMMKVKLLQDLGVKTSVFLADWHSWINEKLGGNLQAIRETAKGYFKEALVASLKCVGANPKKVEFVLGSDAYHNHDDYWATVIDVSKATTLARMRRSIDILGRQESDEIDFAKLIYPAMQVADIFFQGVHIAHAGTDQRKAHVIMRDVWSSIRPDLKKAYNEKFLDLNIKPIALHHHLILGLQKPAQWPIQGDARELKIDMKMSKSKPDSAIFVHDSEVEIREKIKKAFCPPGEISYNPILDWTEHLIFPLRGGLEVQRKPEHGGNVTYTSPQALLQDYQGEKLHPEDLKDAVARALIDILKPAREHFASGGPRRALEGLQKVTS